MGRLAFLVAPWLSCEIRVIAVKSFKKAFLNLWIPAVQESGGKIGYKGSSVKQENN